MSFLHIFRFLTYIFLTTYLLHLNSPSLLVSIHPYPPSITNPLTSNANKTQTHTKDLCQHVIRRLLPKVGIQVHNAEWPALGVSLSHPFLPGPRNVGQESQECPGFFFLLGLILQVLARISFFFIIIFKIWGRMRRVHWEWFELSRHWLGFVADSKGCFQFVFVCVFSSTGRGKSFIIFSFFYQSLLSLSNFQLCGIAQIYFFVYLF